MLVMAGSVGIDRVAVLASEHIFDVARAGFPASRAKSRLPLLVASRSGPVFSRIVH
jgi:hypothetical protein